MVTEVDRENIVKKIDFNKIKDLNEEIAKLIKEKPELQELQNEIKERTEGLTPHNKQQVILSMMTERREKMINTAQDIASLCEKGKKLAAAIDWDKVLK